MFFPLLHGLLNKKKKTMSNNSISFTEDAFNAPLGISCGSYSINSKGEIYAVFTKNLPDFEHTCLRDVILFFNLERFNTEQGDFIIANTHPSLNSNHFKDLTIIQNIEALKLRKFISYFKGNGWTEWRELNTTTKVLAEYIIEDFESVEVKIDPKTITEYFVKVNFDSVVNFILSDKKHFSKKVYIDLLPYNKAYTVNWSSDINWIDGKAPTNVDPGTRHKFELELSDKNEIIGSFKKYRVY